MAKEAWGECWSGPCPWFGEPGTGQGYKNHKLGMFLGTISLQTLI